MPNLVLGIDASKAKPGADQFQAAANQTQQAATAAAGSLNQMQAQVNATGEASSFAAKQMALLQAEIAALSTTQAATNELKQFDAAAVAVTGASTAMKGATLSMASLNAVIAANPIGLAVTAITLLVGAMALMGNETDSTEKALKAQNKELEQTKHTVEGVAEAWLLLKRAQSFGTSDEAAASTKSIMGQLERLSALSAGGKFAEEGLSYSQMADLFGGASSPSLSGARSQIVQQRIDAQRARSAYEAMPNKYMIGEESATTMFSDTATLTPQAKRELDQVEQLEKDADKVKNASAIIEQEITRLKGVLDDFEKQKSDGKANDKLIADQEKLVASIEETIRKVEAETDAVGKSSTQKTEALKISQVSSDLEAKGLEYRYDLIYRLQTAYAALDEVKNRQKFDESFQSTKQGLEDEIELLGVEKDQREGLQQMLKLEHEAKKLGITDISAERYFLELLTQQVETLKEAEKQREEAKRQADRDKRKAEQEEAKSLREQTSAGNRIDKMFDTAVSEREALEQYTGGQQKVNDIRQRARQLTEFQRVAEVAYAGDLDKVTEATDRYASELERLYIAKQRDQALNEMYKANKGIDDQMGALGTHDRFLQDNAAAISRYREDTNRAFGEGSDQANASLDQFISKLHELEQMKTIEQTARDMGNAISAGLDEAMFSGKSLNDVLKNTLLALEKIAFSSFVSKPLGDAAGGIFGQIMSSFAKGGGAGAGDTSPSGYAHGGVFSGGSVIPFAYGDVVSSPSSFPMAGGKMGLMGESGAEAIMPLQRTSDGRLGVRSEGGGGTTVIFNVRANDPSKFRQSMGQAAYEFKKAMGR